MSQNKIKNPIIPGFYPDPSICRVGDDFYMVCSSFEMYPGIPVFHSKDLANWEQICYAMTKENGFYVDANVYAGGVMAPTIRYNNGVFYIINANFADKGNFIVTATNPAGPWSDPYYLDVPGIDASLFFDDDGSCYVMSTGNVVKRADGTMDRGIWIADFDIETMKMTSEPVAIWDSALRVATSPEAPHIYKVGDYYYLLIAEGGTEHYHAVTIARSKDIKGWYEGNPANPIMTHRQFGFYYPIGNVGHADFVDTPDGKWYAVMLASRTIDGIHKNLGRETYICPMIWEREWPLLSPESGKIDWEYPADESLPWTPYPAEAEFDDFDSNNLAMYWSFWGTPFQDFWKVEDSCMKLKCLKRPMVRQVVPMPLKKQKYYDDCVSVVLRRQRHIDFEASCQMNFMAKDAESAGFVVMQAMNHQYKVQKVCKDGAQVIQFVQTTTDFNVPPYMPHFDGKTQEVILKEMVWDKEEVVIVMKAYGNDYNFYLGTSKEDLVPLYEHADGKIINPEKVGGMVGTMVGIFASGNGVDSDNAAAFDWFEYKGI